jgi:hypothetical protein
MSIADQIVPGRECGACMMCCKLPTVTSMNKAANKWCVEAAPGRGCKIYNERPGECRSFHCGWLVDASMGPEWKPDVSKFMIYVAGDGALNIMVDPASPAAWRDPRFYAAIKTNASKLLDRGNMPTMIIIGSKRIVVLPDRDLEITIPPGHGAKIVTMQGPSGLYYDVVVEPLSAA